VTISCGIILAMALAAQTGTGFSLKSGVFAPGAAIPQAHTCDGADASPPLTWSGAPAGTRAFALVVHDPDAPAGDWLHWVAWNIPAGTHALPAGISKKESLPDGTQQGRNDFGKPGYGGPCPPGGTHHYVFALYALDAMLTLSPDAPRDRIEKEIRAHELAMTELTGIYERRKR
jgi:Raf kinase inhibitor-like YbhB/YbcL family protein